ncbi:MAG: hypothetical protein WBC44_06835 [Planctomycetaceae bacterium]
MSGRFAGSKSVDDRRRRRIAAEENLPTSSADAAKAAEKPLPIQRPTGRFPLRRIVSRSPWKLAGVALAVFAVCVTGLAAGYSPAVSAGKYGPGIASLCDAETGRLATVFAGLLLLVSGQFAWLIRWARARSLRDFRGRYRVWWWASLALVAGGVSLLTDAHVAFASTAVWLTGQTLFGSDIAFRLLPAVFAAVVLLPSLQQDMRDCRTSRSLILFATLLWLAGGAAQLAPDAVIDGLRALEIPIPFTALTTGLCLAGAVLTFASLLFHARHVVYESVEPPELPIRKKKPAKSKAGASGDGEVKPKRTSRRSSRAKAESTTAATSPERPKEQQPASAVAAPVRPTPKPAIESKPSAIRNEPVPKIASASSKPAPPSIDDDWSDDEDGATDADGRQYRLDGPEDALKGMSKRERRKQRKAMRDRDRSGS